MYDHDQEDLDVLGYEEFVLRQWESIFVGYRSNSGLRRLCRRWSDLFEAGIGCSQEIADQLVRVEIMERADRDLEGVAKATELLAAMASVLADVRFELEKAAAIEPEQLTRMLDQHERLRSVVLGGEIDSRDEHAATP